MHRTIYAGYILPKVFKK